MWLCEAAGYSNIIIESVGVGQSEVELDQIVDLSILLLSPSSGDDLQASKKGIMEAIDMIIVNKADGDSMPAALITKAEYSSYVHMMRKRGSRGTSSVATATGMRTRDTRTAAAVGDSSDKFMTRVISSASNTRSGEMGAGKEAMVTDGIPVMLMSLKTREGYNDVLSTILSLQSQMKSDGSIHRKRYNQRIYWMWSGFQSRLVARGVTDSNVLKLSAELEGLVGGGVISHRRAADLLLSAFIDGAKS